MGPDADHGYSIANVDKSVHHEEHGLVLPNQKSEPAVPWDGDPLGLAVVEVCHPPFVLGGKVIKKRSR